MSRATQKAPGDILGPKEGLPGCCGMSPGAAGSPEGAGPHCPDRSAGSGAGSGSPQQSEGLHAYLGVDAMLGPPYLRQLSLMNTV